MPLTRTAIDDDQQWPITVTFDDQTEFELLLKGTSRRAKRHVKVLNSMPGVRALLLVHTKDGDIKLPFELGGAGFIPADVSDIPKGFAVHRHGHAEAKDGVLPYRLVWRNEQGEIVREFTDMTAEDVFEALELTMKELQLVLGPGTRYWFMTGAGPLSMTVENDE